MNKPVNSGVNHGGDVLLCRVVRVVTVVNNTMTPGICILCMFELMRKFKLKTLLIILFTKFARCMPKEGHNM